MFVKKEMREEAAKQKTTKEKLILNCSASLVETFVRYIVSS